MATLPSLNWSFCMDCGEDLTPKQIADEDSLCAECVDAIEGPETPRSGECPNPEAHPIMLDFYGECTWCGATDLPKPTDGKA